MNNTEAPLTINGTEPLVLGQACTGLVVQSCYDGNVLVDPANVTYFRFGEMWHCIYFEPDMLFWRSGEKPEQPINSSLEYGLIHNDLTEHPAVAGRRLLELTYSCNDAGDVEACFRFEGGRQIKLKYNAQADAAHLDA
jgi:hypothetical protein